MSSQLTTTAVDTSATKIIEQAIDLAKEKKDSSGILSDAFIKALAEVRAIDDNHYILNLKPVIKLLKTDPPISVGDIEKLTKPPKSSKPRYSQKEEDNHTEQGRQGKTDLLIDFVSQWAQVFCDESGKAYATFPVQSLIPETGELLPPHHETWPLDSKQFRGKVSREFRKAYGIVPGESAIKEATEVLAADAEDRPAEPVYLRVAPNPSDEGGY